MIQEIYVVDDDENLTLKLVQIFKKDKGYKFKQIKTEELNKALRNIPSLIIINEDKINVKIQEICRRIRHDEDNAITPMVVIGKSRTKKHRINILQESVEYYISKPIDKQYLYNVIRNIVRLMYMNRIVSPLTGLPGNVQIQTEIKKRLANDHDFAVLYLDLDNFKAYNDLYGFSKGDQIIKFTARTISASVQAEKYESGFVGHIGGDDFIAIVEEKDAEEICEKIIEEFDLKVTKFFTQEDVKKGYIEIENRKGVVEKFPITSISIGVVSIDNGRFKNALEIGEAGAQVKHIAKTMAGSKYVLDRRKGKFEE